MSPESPRGTAERIHNAIPALRSIPDARSKRSGYNDMALLPQKDAGDFVQGIGQNDLGIADPGRLPALAETYAQRSFRNAMDDFAARTTHDLQYLAMQFTETLMVSLVRILKQRGLSLEEITAIVEERAAELFSSFAGAMQNAVATVCGLTVVLWEKLPRPAQSADAGDWKNCEELFGRCLMQNIVILREIASFHFEVQLVFHNLQGIGNRSDHYVYPFDPEQFSLPMTGKMRTGRLDFDEHFVGNIIQVCNDPEAMVSENNKPRPIHFDGPAVGCFILQCNTEHGNFFNKFCQWLHKMLHGVITPNLRNFALREAEQGM